MPAGLIAFAIAVAFWPNVMNVATTPKWAIAGVCSAAYAQWHTLSVVFIAYALLSVTWAPNTYDAIMQFAQLAILALAFTWGYHVDSITRITQGLSVGLAVSGVVAILQTFAVALPFEQGVAPSGLFFNKNFMGEAAALCLIACITSRLWVYSLLVLPALVLSTSRSAWLAVAISLFSMLKLPERCGVLALMLYATPAYLKYGNLDTASLWQRLEIWDDGIRNMTFWGNGIGSYSGSAIDTLATRTFEMHNDWLQFIYELGAPAALFMAILLWRTWSPVILCLFVIGSLGFPLHLPVTGWFAALMCGHLLGNSTVRSGALLRERVARAQPGQDRLRAFGLPIR